VDSDFASQLLGNFEKTVQDNHYALEPEEVQLARATLAETSSPPSPPLQAINEEWMFHQQEMRKRTSAQVDRIVELGEFTVKILKDTLSYAARTYRAITRMNAVMFSMGVILFLFAAVEGAIFRNLSYTAAFAGLGAASFVGLFFMGPIERTQAALANLIQAEVTFMNYFEQITFCENFGLTPNDETGKPDPDRIQKASALLQQRSAETIEILQKYLKTQRKGTSDESGKTSQPSPPSSTQPELPPVARAAAGSSNR
jgi:hypothetical protein